MLKEPIINLSERLSDEFVGIFCPENFKLDFDNRGVTKQFLDSADDYHNRYTNYPRFKGFLQSAINKIPNLPEIKNILDIGSGSGNSLFPLFELFPKAKIKATDISPQLLRMLQSLMTVEQKSRTELYCMDLCDADFIENQFDLGVGAAILHHMIDPEKVITQCFKSIRPGGWLVFFEPFEVGNSILKLCYTMILNQAGYRDTIGRWTNILPDGLEENNKFKIPEATAIFLINFIADLQFRSGRDKSHPDFQKLDDKWLFTNSYFQNIAKNIAARELIINRLESVPNQFTHGTLTYFKIALNQQREALPDWAWEIIRVFDGFFSEDLQNDFYPEAMVLIKK